MGWLAQQTAMGSLLGTGLGIPLMAILTGEEVLRIEREGVAPPATGNRLWRFNNGGRSGGCLGVRPGAAANQGQDEEEGDNDRGHRLRVDGLTKKREKAYPAKSHKAL
jgi:hypothetical protein